MSVRTERRRSPRARATTEFRLRLPGMKESAEVKDLSASGVCCTMSHSLPLLSQIQMTLFLPAPPNTSGASREVVCTGAVVRCAKTGPTYETAIYFTDVEDDDRAALDGYVSSQRRAGQVA